MLFDCMMQSCQEVGGQLMLSMLLMLVLRVPCS